MYQSSFKRVVSATGQKLVMHPSSLARTTRWLGASLEEWQLDGPGEFPEGFLLDHMVSLSVGPPVRRSIRWNGKGWQDGVIEPMTCRLMPAQVPSSARWNSTSRSIVVTLKPAFVAACIGATTGMIELEPNVCLPGTLVSQLILALGTDARNGSPYGSQFGESLVVALGAYLATHHARSGAKATGRRAADDVKRERLHAACDYINDNIACDLHLTELAGVAQLELGQLIRIFKQKTGLSPHQYIMRQRIERGKALLRDSKLPLFTIAERCGFSSASHFTNVFRRITKITPRAYRRG